jgi:hypothetical protein
MAENEKKPKTRAKTPRAKAEATPKVVTRARKPQAAAVPTPTEVRYEHIAECAYYLWQASGGGDPTAHWLQAERELAAA